jgi:hypothetical protein
MIMDLARVLATLDDRPRDDRGAKRAVGLEREVQKRN